MAKLNIDCTLSIFHQRQNDWWIHFFSSLWGNFFYGLGIGFAMHGAPTYLGELILPNIWGTFVSLKEVMIVIGILLGYRIGFHYSLQDNGWAYSYLVSLVPSVAMMIALPFLPLSCWWLVLQRQHEEALDSLKFIYKPEITVQEHNALLAATDHAHITNDTSFWQFFAASSCPALVAGLWLVVLQQATGQPSVLSYATAILTQAGLALSTSVVIATWKVHATGLAFEKIKQYNDFL